MRFVANPKAAVLIGASAEMIRALRERAEEAAGIAREIAPRETGAYAESIEVDAGIEDGQAKARLNAFDFKAHWIEFGTYKWAAHATLRQAVEASGLKLRGKGSRRGRA